MEVGKHKSAGMTWPAIRDVAARVRAVVIPMGAIKHRGPRLPADTGVRVIDAICSRA